MATLFEAEETDYTATVEVIGVIFAAEDDGYAVLEVEDIETAEGFALVGPVAHLGPGDRAEVSGEWQTHSRYGRQLRARGALPLDPADRAGRIAYLTSLRHIGPARAERLVEEHGESVLSAIAADPAGVFGSLRGVSGKQAAAAAQSWQASRALRDLHVQLAPHGLAHLAAPIHARFGDRSTAILHEDPYRLTEVDGVGFARADRIALAADVPPRVEPPRPGRRPLRARRSRAAGPHVPAAGRALRADGEADRPRPRPRRGRRGAPACSSTRAAIYREPTHESEVAVAGTLAGRAAQPPHLDHVPGDAPEGSLTDEQWAAVRGAFAARISILTGGPGVGKTVCTQGDRRRGRGRPTRRSRSARRPDGRRGGWRRRPATRRRRSTACSSGCPAASPPSGPATPSPPTS